jgi:two-component system, sensor histidine kinase and response regulator
LGRDLLPRSNLLFFRPLITDPAIINSLNIKYPTGIMTTDKSVKFRDSVAYQLLKIVFAIYFFISISITLGHMFMEYRSAKDMVVHELVLLQKAFEDGLSTSLYDLNNEQLQSIVEGMYNVPTLVGFKVEPTNPEIPVTAIAIGTTVSADGTRLSINRQGPNQTSVESVNALIVHTFAIYQPETRTEIAEGTLYSSEGIIFAKVQAGFIRIILSAIVKTILLWWLFLWAARGRLSRPLRKMTKDISQLNLDDLQGVTIDSKTKEQNELKILEQSFNEMIRNLALARQDLQNYAVELEEKNRALTDTAQKYRQIFENASEGLFQFSQTGRIINANPALAKMFGYDAIDELIFQVNNVAEQCYVNPADHIDFTGQVQEQGRVTGLEKEFKRKDGHTFWGMESGQLVCDQQGNILYYEGSVVDITAQKEKIQAERAQIVAEEASRAKSSFLANMSHEIRTPMNAIIGLTHLALKTELTIKQLDYLKKIESSGHSLLGIINDILDFSKIEVGKLHLELIKFNLEVVLENVATVIAVKAEEKELELLFQISTDVPVDLIGDPLRLGQILINLAGNAVKFTKSGHVLIKVEQVKEKEFDPKQIKLRFLIEDTGIGMNKQQIRKLFCSFSQADESTTRKYGGTGLGLTISKHLVEMMDGEIAVASEPDRGSKFCFTIRMEVAPDHKDRVLECPVDLQGVKVLVVDDNAIARDIICKSLESFSLQTHQVSGGEESISELEKAAAAGTPYDLVIMDWKMPGLNGIETSKQIKNSSKLTKIPVIFLVTAYSHVLAPSQIEEVGIDTFLLKPVNSSLLFNAIVDAFSDTSEEKQHSHPNNSKNNNIKIEAVLGAHLLLVEDNEINQQVATELLEDAGYQVTVVNTGRQAVDILTGKDSSHLFDCVLMDIQMPELDGHEATRLIRDWEEITPSAKRAAFATPKSAIPIIAMTAHAMASERQKCLDSGMNDHISKPIDPDLLFKTLVKWIKPAARKEATHMPLKKSSVETVELPEKLSGFDLEAGLSRVAGNRSLLLDLLLQLYRKYRQTDQQIRQALQDNNLELAERLAHTIKGMAGNLGASALHTAANDLETAINHNDSVQFEKLLTLFAKSLQAAMQSIKPIEQQANIATRAPVPNGESLDTEEIMALLKEISTLIFSDYGAAIDRITALKSLRHDAKVSSLFQELIDHLNEFNEDAAITCLNQISTVLAYPLEEKSND